MKKYLTNPWIVCVVCMILFVVMYNYASNGFMRACSYVPLAVVVALFLKGVYWAFKKP